jgi:hypothetical protein
MGWTGTCTLTKHRHLDAGQDKRQANRLLSGPGGVQRAYATSDIEFRAASAPPSWAARWRPAAWAR